MEAGWKLENAIEMEAVSKPRYGVKEGRYIFPYLENVDDLRRMFDDWVRTYRKVYSSDAEREEMFTIFLENKKYVDKQNSPIRSDVLGLNKFRDKRACKIVYGCCVVRYTPLSYVGMRADPTGMTGEECKEAKPGQVPISSLGMRRLFDEWAAGNRKVYSSDKEREERFQIFVSTNKYLNEQNALMMMSGGVPYGLNEFSDRKDHELPFGCCIGGYNPPRDLWMPQDALMNNEELKEKWIEFERWAAAHKKVYASEEARRFRFMFFLDNKRRFEIDDRWEQSSLGDFWTCKGYDWSVMDLMGIEM